MEKFPEIYTPKPKFFKEKAERIERPEYDNIIKEILGETEGVFRMAKAVEPLKDKESFGDIDIICLPKEEINEEYFKKIFKEKLKEYHREKGSSIHSLLLSLKSGKQVQVDFIRSKDKIDFERKLMYHSKGHFSSIAGILAKKFNFKYGTEGFFKRFRDKKGNWHDIFISDSLRDGLKILGFNPDSYENIETTDDIINLLPRRHFLTALIFNSRI